MTVQKLIYQEVELDKILAIYVKGFKFPDEGTLATWNALVDPVQRKVVFKLMVDVPVIAVPDNGKIVTMNQ